VRVWVGGWGEMCVCVCVWGGGGMQAGAWGVVGPNQSSVVASSKNANICQPLSIQALHVLRAESNWLDSGAVGSWLGSGLQ